MRILRTIIRHLYRAERPLAFFTAIGLALAIMSVGFAIPIFVTFVETGLVPRLPTAVLSTGLMMLAAPVDFRRIGARYRDARAGVR